MLQLKFNESWGMQWLKYFSLKYIYFVLYLLILIENCSVLINIILTPEYDVGMGIQCILYIYKCIKVKFTL